MSTSTLMRVQLSIVANPLTCDLMALAVWILVPGGGRARKDSGNQPLQYSLSRHCTCNNGNNCNPASMCLAMSHTLPSAHPLHHHWNAL